jgi:hypothetical protein
MLQSRKKVSSIPDKVTGFLSQFALSFLPHYDFGVDSVSNRNDDQESSPWD